MRCGVVGSGCMSGQRHRVHARAREGRVVTCLYYGHANGGRKRMFQGEIWGDGDGYCGVTRGVEGVVAGPREEGGFEDR